MRSMRISNEVRAFGLGALLFLIGLVTLGQGIGPLPPTSVGTAVPGQIPGTSTNDSAGPGKVGEYVISGASSFSRLFVNKSATVTITIAAPGVVSWTGNPYFLSGATNNGCASLVMFTTTGTLPTGITSGTAYYVTCDANFNANQFDISTSVANAIAGIAVTTSGTQSGTQTATNNYAVTTSTSFDFGGLSLTAGDWDVTGVMVFLPNPTTSVSLTAVAITDTTLLGGNAFVQNIRRQAAEVPTSSLIQPMGTERISISSTTTYFCGGRATFTVDILSAGGECRARRMR